MKNYVITFLIGIALGWFAQKRFNPCRESPAASQVVRVDTVKVEIPVPVRTVEVRREIVKAVKIRDTLPSRPSMENIIPENDTPVITSRGEVEIPITRKIYRGEDFKAVVEGWRPNLKDLEIYPKTVIKTKAPKFSITAGPAIGWDGKIIRPYFGITAGVVLFSR